MVGTDFVDHIVILVICYSGMVMLILLGLYVVFTWLKSKNKEETNKKETKKTPNEPKVVAQLKPLTAEQIANIHSRGKITPAELVQEWEDMGICAPGNAIGSAADRCHRFIDCHNCLVDYANQQEEYTSFYDCLSITNCPNHSVTLVNQKLDDN